MTIRGLLNRLRGVQKETKTDEQLRSEWESKRYEEKRLTTSMLLGQGLLLALRPMSSARQPTARSNRKGHRDIV